MPSKLIKSFNSAAVVVALLSAGLANADVLDFHLSGDYTAEWQLNSTLTPDFVSPGAGFLLASVSGNFPGTPNNQANLYFYNASNGGGLGIDAASSNQSLLLTGGPQLYTGTEGAPVFQVGSFDLTAFDGPGSYTLTVTDLDAAAPTTSVPEPATGALLLGGVGLLAALRKRRSARKAPVLAE
jgi:hypothetical protein